MNNESNQSGDQNGNDLDSSDSVISMESIESDTIASYQLEAEDEHESIDLETVSDQNYQYDDSDELSVIEFIQDDETKPHNQDFINDQCESCSIQCGTLLFMELMDKVHLLDRDQAVAYSQLLCDTCEMCGVMKELLQD